MKISPKLALVFTLLLVSCQPAVLPTVTIIDNDQVVTLQTKERKPSVLISQAGWTLSPNDRVISKGIVVAPDLSIDQDPIMIQIRRARTVTLITPNGEQTLQTAAFTVGDVLAELSFQLHIEDQIEPPLGSPLQDGMTIIVTTPRILTINVDGKSLQIQSSARTVGEALAEAEIPLLGLDYSIPAEDEALPSDGRIKLVRVSETILLAQKSIPFDSELVASSEIPLDQTKILSMGENGLSLQRVRVRYEDGVEVSRVTEEETTVRAPKTRTLAYGTKVEIKTAVVNGVTIEYWRAVQMYATSYSPCNLGTSTCGSTTASGKQLAKGVVALRTDLYRALQGQLVYVPGYGFATVEDACGGCVGKPWIDLGYSDSDYIPWHSTVMVYFLTPVPQNIIYNFE